MSLLAGNFLQPKIIQGNYSPEQLYDNPSHHGMDVAVCKD